MISFGRAPCDEGVIRAAAETPGCADSAKPWVLPYKYEAGTPLLRSDPWMVSQARPHPWRDLGIGRLNHGMSCASGSKMLLGTASLQRMRSSGKKRNSKPSCSSKS
jgi:hypothetical protein